MSSSFLILGLIIAYIPFCIFSAQINDRHLNIGYGVVTITRSHFTANHPLAEPLSQHILDMSKGETIDDPIFEKFYLQVKNNPLKYSKKYLVKFKEHIKCLDPRHYQDPEDHQHIVDVLLHNLLTLGTFDQKLSQAYINVIYPGSLLTEIFIPKLSSIKNLQICMKKYEIMYKGDRFWIGKKKNGRIQHEACYTNRCLLILRSHESRFFQDCIAGLPIALTLVLPDSCPCKPLAKQKTYPPQELNYKIKSLYKIKQLNRNQLNHFMNDQLSLLSRHIFELYESEFGKAKVLQDFFPNILYDTVILPVRHRIIEWNMQRGTIFPSDTVAYLMLGPDLNVHIQKFQHPIFCVTFTPPLDTMFTEDIYMGYFQLNPITPNTSAFERYNIPLKMFESILGIHCLAYTLLIQQVYLKKAWKEIEEWNNLISEKKLITINDTITVLNHSTIEKGQVVMLTRMGEITTNYKSFVVFSVSELQLIRISE